MKREWGPPLPSRKSSDPGTFFSWRWRRHAILSAKSPEPMFLPFKYTSPGVIAPLPIAVDYAQVRAVNDVCDPVVAMGLGEMINSLPGIVMLGSKWGGFLPRTRLLRSLYPVSLYNGSLTVFHLKRETIMIQPGEKMTGQILPQRCWGQSGTRDGWNWLGT